jgi:glycerophosphoryl diester phosphodiesterase
MEVLEQFVEAKSGRPAKCEDFVVVGDHFLAVIDGATDKTGAKFRGVSGGRFAAEVIGAAIPNLEPAITGRDAITEISRALDVALQDAGAPVPDDRPSAVCAIYSREQRQIWRVGDVTIRLNGRSRYGTKRIDRVTAGTRSAFLQSLHLYAQHTPAEQGPEDAPDIGRDLILPLLRNQHLFRNARRSQSRFAHGAIDGQLVPREFIEITPVDFGTEVMLASDGYPRVLDTLEKSETYLHKDLARDPLRIWRHPSTKGVRQGDLSYDDRAWLRFSI